MINVKHLYVAYRKLYEEMRRFIWDWDTAHTLAELECELYRACPDMSKVQEIFDKMCNYIKYTGIEDEFLRKELLDFRAEINQSTDTFMKLSQVQEVLVKS